VDVVIAAATPPGRGAIALVRLSGPGTRDVVARIADPFTAGPIPSGRPRRVRLRDAAGVFDDGVVTLGRAPRTFTGEDTAEIGLHGNPLAVERLITAAVAAGARVAAPGEFTRRALAHGKLDLVGAEAVLQAADATTDEGLRIARGALDGQLSAMFAEFRASLITVAADLEARLDYPADELAYLDDDAVLARLDAVALGCAELAATADAGRVLVHGARVALVGAVNAGKSSLFNALLGRRRALVHETAGTTRDVLEVQARIGGLAVTLLDTAGERDTADPIEAAGLALARELVADADLLVVVLRARAGGLDPTEAAILERTANSRRVIVLNGVDALHAGPPPGAVPTVATSGAGVDALAAAIRAALLGVELRDGALAIASARQRDLLARVAALAGEAREALGVAGPAVAADCAQRAIAAIDELTGADSREAVLDELFARFCLGK
jgi:tRNA modification GTPase